MIMPTSNQSPSQPEPESEPDVAQIMADLRKGEKTAEALESNLTSLEKKIDDLLASFEDEERRKVEVVDENDVGGGKTQSEGDGEGKGKGKA